MATAHAALHLESLPLSAIVFDRASRVITFATTSACQLFTSTVGDVLGASVESLWSDPASFRSWLGAWEVSRSESSIATRKPVGNNGSALQVELSQLKANGVCMLLSKPPLKAESHPEAPNLVSERQLALQRLEALGTMAGGIAHDFNNMLTVIETHAGFLRHYFEATHPERANVEIVLHAAERAARLTSQLLAYSRRQIQELEVTDLNGVVAALTSVIETTLGSPIRLQLELDPELAPCEVDPAQMEQVILNLVVNAKDAMPNGGTLELRTHNVCFEAKFVPHTSARIEPGRYVALSVRDTGAGMDRQTCLRVFDPFFTTKDPLQSPGLGLSTVYGIIKQSRGYVWADSEVGQGTTFRIFLPLSETESLPEPSRRRPSVALTGRRVLVVEDEPLVRRAARRILEREGCQVVEAGDGVSALELCRIQRERFDLVVTDMVMPQMSGRELAEQLVEKYPDIAVLLISGYTDEEVVTKALHARGATFLQKPFAPEVLLRKVEQALSQRQGLALS